MSCMGTRPKISAMGSGQSQQSQQGHHQQPQTGTGFQRTRSGRGRPQPRKAEPRRPEFPSTLEGFGYTFNENGELRHIETNQPFDYNAHPTDDEYNQRRYKAIGELVTKYIYMLLENKIHLCRPFIPVITIDSNKPQSFFFMSQDALTNPDKLLILIHGSGNVRAGQWSRRLVINESLYVGSQLPYITRALKEGFGVIVLNTNHHKGYTKDGKEETVKFGVFSFIPSSPERHAEYVWDNFVRKANAPRIAIVAHSYGGVVTSHLMSRKGFLTRVYAVAFTDAVHRTPSNYDHRRFFGQNAINWICSKLPLDTPIKGPENDTHLVSAGTTEHERTSSSSIDSVFRFLSQKYLAIEPPANPPQRTRQKRR